MNKYWKITCKGIDRIFLVQEDLVHKKTLWVGPQWTSAKDMPDYGPVFDASPEQLLKLLRKRIARQPQLKFHSLYGFLIEISDGKCYCKSERPLC